jgi:putative FmdB family regulatory protein
MPLYEFVCEECEHSFETLTRTGKEVECPECKSARVQRQLSLPARPVSAPSSSTANVCNSSGPPCGPVCRRFQG